MDYDVHPIAAEYPPMAPHDLGRMEQDMRQRGFDPRFPVVLFDGQILDGRNRAAAARAAGVTPAYVEFSGTEEDARLFAQRANEERRHLARDWLEQRRAARLERVAALRREGHSLPAIAEAEGVSVAQVRRDLDDAGRTLPGGKVTPAGGVVTGRDGRQQPARRTSVPEPRQPDRDDRQDHPEEAPQEHPADEPQREQPPAAGAVLDGEGNPVPERLCDIFADAFLAGAVRDLKAWHEAGTVTPILAGIRKRWRHLTYLPLEDACARLEAIDRAFELALDTLRHAAPYAPCAACAGEGCDRCRHGGYLPQWAWEDARR